MSLPSLPSLGCHPLMDRISHRGSTGRATRQLLTMPRWLRSCWSHLHGHTRHAVREAGRQALLLIEKVLSWLTGCAWTNVFFASAAKPSLYLALKARRSHPSPTPSPSHPRHHILLSPLPIPQHAPPRSVPPRQDLALAVGLMFVAISWLVILGGRMELAAGLDRSEAESYFLCNSASFFVGWAWVTSSPRGMMMMMMMPMLMLMMVMMLMVMMMMTMMMLVMMMLMVTSSP